VASSGTDVDIDRFLLFKASYGGRVFENRVLTVFGPKREEVAGGWRRLHNEELRNLYASPDVIRVIESRTMRWARHVTCIGEMRNVYKILVGKRERKRLL
jgi:hypothetical protein